MNAAAVTGDPDAYYDFLRGQLDFPILGDPHSCILDPEWFYDTNFHLNESGRQLNTRNLTRDLKAQLGDTTPTEIAVPDPPAPATAETALGDNSDADCFTFQKWGQRGGAHRCDGGGPQPGNPDHPHPLAGVAGHRHCRRRLCGL